MQMRSFIATNNMIACEPDTIHPIEEPPPSIFFNLSEDTRPEGISQIAMLDSPNRRAVDSRLGVKFGTFRVIVYCCRHLSSRWSQFGRFQLVNKNRSAHGNADRTAIIPIIRKVKRLDFATRVFVQVFMWFVAPLTKQ
jgi:hypothetical protein